MSIFVFLHLDEPRTHVAGPDHILDTVSSHLGFISANLTDSLTPIFLTHLTSPSLFFFCLLSCLRGRGFGPHSAFGSPLTQLASPWQPCSSGFSVAFPRLSNNAGDTSLYPLSAAEITGSAKSSPQAVPQERELLTDAWMPFGSFFWFLPLTSSQIHTNPV